MYCKRSPLFDSSFFLLFYSQFFSSSFYSAFSLLSSFYIISFCPFILFFILLSSFLFGPLSSSFLSDFLSTFLPLFQIPVYCLSLHMLSFPSTFLSILSSSSSLSHILCSLHSVYIFSFSPSYRIFPSFLSFLSPLPPPPYHVISILQYSTCTYHYLEVPGTSLTTWTLSNELIFG